MKRTTKVQAIDYRIDYRMDAGGNWAVWLPGEYEIPDAILHLIGTRFPHSSGRDYIPCADRATAARLAALCNADH